MVSAAIALFAKAPIAGSVKTRLQPPLSPEQAADLHFAFVQDTWARLSALDDVSLYLYSNQPWPAYEALAGPGRSALQRGADLGEKMLRCFEDLHARGHGRLLIVGSDSPTLPLDYLLKGLDLLNEADAVLGPSEDGGYYSVGCRRPHEAMFAGVTWSTSTTLEETERAFQQLDWSVERLPPWYDIDTKHDLERLARETGLPEHTRRWLEETQLPNLRKHPPPSCDRDPDEPEPKGIA